MLFKPVRDRSLFALFLLLSIASFFAAAPVSSAPIPSKPQSAQVAGVLAEARKMVAAGQNESVAALLHSAAKSKSPADRRALLQILSDFQLTWGNRLADQGYAALALGRYQAGLSVAREIPDRSREAKQLGGVGKRL